MRTISPTLSAYLAGDSGLQARVLFWIGAKDRGTGATVNFGFWNGDDDADFTINSVVRTYHGAGDVALPDPITYSAGLQANTYELPLSPLSPAVQDALRTYEPRFAPVEIHRAFFDTVSGALIEEPTRVFKGQVDTVSIGTPAVNGEADGKVVMLSSAVFLTRKLSQTKSEATQRLRSDDRFFKYIDITGQVTVSWGSK